MAPHRRTPKKPRRQIPLTFQHKNFKGRNLGRHFQAAVWNLYKYFRAERLRGGPLRNVKQVCRRVSDALKIGKNVVTDVIKKGKLGDAIETPGKDRKMIRRKRDVDTFTKEAIRRLIYDSNIKRIPMTVKDLLFKIRENEIEFSGGEETLRKVLHDLGFKYKKRDGLRYLIETPRIVQLRRSFLRKFSNAYNDGTKLRVYLDETWVFRRGSDKTKGWQDTDVRSCPTRHADSAGRYVVIHAGSREGVVPGAGKLFPTKEKPLPGEDYHGDMDGAIMKQWWCNQLLPGLSRPSVIFMDNAPYHTCQARQWVHDMLEYFNLYSF